MVISLSFDDPDDQDRVLEQPRKLDARIENYLAKYGASDESVKAFDITNGGVCPITKFMIVVEICGKCWPAEGRP